MNPTAMAPTPDDYERAFTLRDEATMLAYLASVEATMVATNAYVLKHGAAPPPRQSPNDPQDHAWFWPSVNLPSLFVSAARYDWHEVVAWFFTSRERVDRLGATLMIVESDMIEAAAKHARDTLIEMLVTSPVFTTLLSPSDQQRALDAALQHADDAWVCDVLVAHGANIHAPAINPSGWVPRNPISWVLSSRAWFAGDIEALLTPAMHWEDPCFRQLVRECIVVHHSVLLQAIRGMETESVAILVSDAFIDIDGRTDDGETLLMKAAMALGDEYPQIVQTLLDANADTTLRDDQGRTVLELTITWIKIDTLEVLLAHYVREGGFDTVHSQSRKLKDIFLHEHYDVEYEGAKRMAALLLEQGACPYVFVELEATYPKPTCPIHMALQKPHPCFVCDADA